VLLLAIDTSGRNGSLGIVRAEKSKFETLALIPLEGRMYSAQLIPALQQAFQQTSLKKTDIDALVVASGPGSFTGLRIGISTVKALSEVLSKPIAAVSVLEAAARVTNVDHPVMVALDAGRKQAFVGEFTANGSRETLVSWEELFKSVRDETVKLFSPDAALWEAGASHQIVFREIVAPQADVFARIGYEKLVRSESTPAETLEANYLRATDAELFSHPKTK
jgi:tRNA threonylcarbamoyladenosine biosynthesis protein TsaB